jgi:hypothetical protein
MTRFYDVAFVMQAAPEIANLPYPEGVSEVT